MVHTVYVNQASLAQMVEQLTFNQLVVGSIPTGGTSGTVDQRQSQDT
jgi:hypothetical protein